MALRLRIFSLHSIFIAAMLLSIPGYSAPVHKNIDSCANALRLSPPASQIKIPVPLRVRSWNIMKFDLPGADDELRRLSRNAHLILLQESLRGVAEKTNSSPYRYFSPGYARGSEATGVEIRSEFPANVICELQFVEPWLGTPKAVSVVRLAFHEAALLLINLHAINFTMTADDYGKQLTTLSPMLNAHSGPVIIAGDFNHWNPWRAATLKRWAQRMALVEVEFELDWRSRHVGSAVDTIFLRGLRAVARAASPTTRSDHHPIAASLVLTTAADQGADSHAAGVSPAQVR